MTSSVASILTIGDELLRGDVVNSNAAWMSTRLTELGFVISTQLSVGDIAQEIIAAVRQLTQRCGVLLISGGLGPTDDDLTTKAIADAAGVALQRDLKSLEVIRRRFERAGFPFTPNNEKQADFPVGATILPNDCGTAPGFSLKLGNCWVFCMPGVPREMQQMFDKSVVSQVVQHFQLQLPQRMTYKTFGLTEAQVDQRLKGILDPSIIDEGAVTTSIHYRPQFPETQVTIIARAKTAATQGASALVLQRINAEIRSRLGHHIYGTNDDTLSSVIVAALAQRKESVALAESCTGGLVAEMITRTPGSSAVFGLGVVAYAYEAKQQQLGVSAEILATHGAVSEACVVEMARRVRQLSGATYGLSISGIAGPDGGTTDKPVGTVHFALATPDAVVADVRHFHHGERTKIRTISAYVALWMLLRKLTAPDNT